MYSQRLISQFTVDILDRVDLFFRTSPIHAHVDIVIYFIQMDIFPARNTCIRGDKGFGNFFEKFSHAIKLISSTLNNIFYFIMHVIKINNFFTSSFAFLKINGMKKMWIMYLLSAFLKKIFPWKSAVILAWLLFLSKWDQTKQTFKLTIYNHVFIR